MYHTLYIYIHIVVNNKILEEEQCTTLYIYILIVVNNKILEEEEQCITLYIYTHSCK